MEIRRRELITGLVTFICAPAIVRISSIMPVRAIDLAFLHSNLRCKVCGDPYPCQHLTSFQHDLEHYEPRRDDHA